jgi:hypothetical protein
LAQDLGLHRQDQDIGTQRLGGAFLDLNAEIV